MLVKDVNEVDMKHLRKQAHVSIAYRLIFVAGRIL